MKRFLQLLREIDRQPYGQLRRISGVHDSRDLQIVVDLSLIHISEPTRPY